MKKVTVMQPMPRTVIPGVKGDVRVVMMSGSKIVMKHDGKGWVNYVHPA